MDREIVPASQAGRDGDEIVPHQPVSEMAFEDVESDSQAEAQGPDSNFKFWADQISAGLTYENRFRTEAEHVEVLYFGPDNDPGKTASAHDNLTSPNEITDLTALIHSTVDVLKPLVYSDTPQPIVRRKFRGDGRQDATDLMTAEVAQRLCQHILDDDTFDDALSGARDDWLVAGRGSARVIYKADLKSQEMIDPETGLPVTDPETGEPLSVPTKTSESVASRYIEWRRLLFAPSHSWELMPWLAIETPMTRTKIIERFGQETADAMSFTNKGLSGQSRAQGDEDRFSGPIAGSDTETGDITISPFDTANVWEIWNKETREVVWWCADYKHGILDKEDDPLGLEDFWPMPKPLLAATRGSTMTPRPDISYYESRAKEIDQASEKMASILKVISISGVFPGAMKEEVAKLLSGKNQMIAVSDWIGLMEKGGGQHIINWLPIDAMIQALQALSMLREQAKAAMFEASGVSDVMRAQGDPNETATAQQIKGRYAGLRLSDRQRTMAKYARNMIRLMLEISVEHFDTEFISEITGLQLPLSEADRAQIIASIQAAEAQYAQAMQQFQQQMQVVEQAKQQGIQVQAPQEPQKPDLPEPPETSFELVHDRLRNDLTRKMSVTIETQSTVLADEQADKEARIEFLGAFTNMVQQLLPLAQSGHFDLKMAKELLLFGVRGFPKSRTLETMIMSMPDEMPEPESEAEQPAVTVAKIRAEVDQLIKKMDMADSEADRQHESKMKGVDMVAEAARMTDAPQQAATPPQQR